MKRARHRLACLALAVAASVAGCGGGRTAAATQPTAATFDPAASDPRAVALADRVIAALGGAAAWEAARQLRWEQRYIRDGKLEGLSRHAWDRWNGRHRFEQIDVADLEKARESGSPDQIEGSVVIYDLLDRAGKGAATFGGKPVDAATRDQLVASAYQSFQADSYRLAAVHKLRDPGVKLHLKSSIQPVKDHCDPGCEVLEVTFERGVGSDTWLVSINTRTGMPDLLEKVMPEGKLGFALSGWVDVAGLKFPTRFDNLGVSETFEIRDLRIGDPDDRLFVPAVAE
jgi:hypothetical protein